MATAASPSSEIVGTAKAEASGGEGGAGSELQPGVVLKKARKERVCTAKERISKMPPCAAGKRSSIYRGVTRSLSCPLSLSHFGSGLGKAVLLQRFTKYRAMPRQSQSSRWDAPLSQMIGTEYYNCSTSKDPPTEGKYGNSFGMERKIDLTSHIRWWAPKITSAGDRLNHEDVGKEPRHLKALSKHPSHISFPCLASKGRRLLEDLLHTASYPSLQPSRASGRKHHKCMMAPVKSQSRGQLLICFPVVNLIAQGSTWDMVSYQSRDRSSRCLLSSLLRSELHGIRWSPCLILFSGRVLCLHQDNHSQQQFHLLPTNPIL
ncbi:hypothetical protein HPP92_013981 [Vanilla planifolia]|uniref:Uncharacterized protein n=1 Tax=Vanilla planifolia TaxID=51239 RepID=A0A835QPE9_VANPL|nr:hypothetical protein HPP92_013981 [Vanilla planifolia]